MKLIYGLLILCAISVASCSKDKFSSRPSLKLKSVNTEYIPYPADGAPDPVLQFVLEYTDREGDLAGMPVCFQKLSSSYPCTDGSRDPQILDTTNYIISEDLPTGTNQKGEIIITLTRSQDLNPIACIPDQDEYEIEDATFKFWVKDHAGNVSDTVTSPIVKIEKK